MKYEFLDSSIERENITLPLTDKINPFLLKNSHDEIIKALDFMASDEKFLYVYGFMGAGKRQFINYSLDFLDKEVIKLEYYCKQATVCDDILLTFTDIVEKNSISKAININTKITTLAVKFKQMVSSIKKPFLIVLHSFDDILPENKELICKTLLDVINEENVKLIVSTRAMNPVLIPNLEEDRKILLQSFSDEVFKEFLETNKITASDRQIEDFYKATRGYYYYTALSLKIIQAMQIDLSKFLQKFTQAGISFDSFLSMTYINLVPESVRNYFWFLRTVRHGLSLNALAIFEIYDEFATQYLKNNLIIFETDEVLYVQDYFLQDIDISIPDKTQIKLHKFIIGIYEKQLKEPLAKRAMLISRQAMRAEIEYHNNCIQNIETKKTQEAPTTTIGAEQTKETQTDTIEISIYDKLAEVDKLKNEKKFTSAIELLNGMFENNENLELSILVEIRSRLAHLYKEIGEYSSASHYYELLETYYKQHNEVINLAYLYYDITALYHKMYKNERAIETIKKVIYSVDTPQSLLVSACTLLGNIYTDINNPEEAYNYYQKALDSMVDNVEVNTLAELYFKYALANDEKGDLSLAFEYYNKCLTLNNNNNYIALAYSNMASCYYDSENIDEAINCFTKAYEIEKRNNNFDGVYYNASNLAKILKEENSSKALDYLLESKKCAEFLNESFYIFESTIELGDYYYNIPKYRKECLKEYFEALKIADMVGINIDISKINRRIQDMKLRMSPEEFSEIEGKYAK